MNEKEKKLLEAHKAYEKMFGEVPSMQWLYETCGNDLDRYIAMVSSAVKRGKSLGEFEGESDAKT